MTNKYPHLCNHKSMFTFLSFPSPPHLPLHKRLHAVNRRSLYYVSIISLLLLCILLFTVAPYPSVGVNTNQYQHALGNHRTLGNGLSSAARNTLWRRSEPKALPRGGLLNRLRKIRRDGSSEVYDSINPDSLKATTGSSQELYSSSRQVRANVRGEGGRQTDLQRVVKRMRGGGTAFVAPYSGVADDEMEEDVYDDDDDEGNVEWKQRLREVLGSDTAKIMYGLGGAAIAGTAGVRYTRSYLSRLYRDKFLRPATALTDLLDHVLVTNSTDGSQGLWDRFYERLIGVKGGGFGPDGTQHRATGDVTKGKVTAIYINGGGLENYLQKSGYVVFTPRLSKIYDLCKRKGDNFEIVYVSIDDKPHIAANHFAQMPWYALPFNDKDRVKHIIRQLGVRTLPAVVLVDETGTIVNDKAYNAMLATPLDFPWHKKTLEDLLGDTFINTKNETIAKSSLDDKEIGLYFAADRVPGCRQFTPMLREAYKNVNLATTEVLASGTNDTRATEEVSTDVKGAGGSRKMEIVFVSNDKDQKQFAEHFYDQMPWLSIPYNDTTRRSMLQDTLDVRVLPSFVLLSKPVNGVRKVLNKSGAAAVSRDPKGKNFPWIPPAVSDVRFYNCF
eukprot:GHVQ01012720.1.p1 GENE.GHVQ01012720.1~~GHVQ01012720.1.p1  ORF type:complete len:614 (+),score=96.29 GHVQ01012720.1:119-1960(+)